MYRQRYFVNGRFNREDGPAVECVNGDKAWYINGKHHRVDGPAVEYPDGTKYYYLNGKEYSYDYWNVARKMPWAL